MNQHGCGRYETDTGKIRETISARREIPRRALRFSVLAI